MRSACVLAAILYSVQVYSADLIEVPLECRTPPRVDNPLKCCNVPKVFEKKELEDCGVFEGDVDSKDQGPLNCEKHSCILRKRGLLDYGGNGTVKREEFRKLLTEQAEKHPRFAQTISTAVARCLPASADPIPGPGSHCEPIKAFLCLTTTMFMECPETEWGQGETCNTMREFIKKCRRYL